MAPNKCVPESNSVYTWDGGEYDLLWCTFHNQPYRLCEVRFVAGRWLEAERYRPGAAHEIYTMLDTDD